MKKLLIATAIILGISTPASATIRAQCQNYSNGILILLAGAQIKTPDELYDDLISVGFDDYEIQAMIPVAKQFAIGLATGMEYSVMNAAFMDACVTE